MCFIYIFTNYIFFFIVCHIPDIVIREREREIEREKDREKYRRKRPRKTERNRERERIPNLPQRL